MAIREKIKAKFGRSKTSSDTTYPTPEGYYMGRKDVEYYKPHEIPKSKYRGKVDKDHQERLDSYSFGDAFSTVRRKSSMALSGTFSPGGTKSLSTAPSAAVSRRASWSSRKGSDYSTAATSEMSNGIEYHKHTVDSDKISENSVDDTDVTNTGLSRRASLKNLHIESNLDSQLNSGLPEIRLDRQATVPATNPQLTQSISNDNPFTMEELERAMTKATLARESMVQEVSLVA